MSIDMKDENLEEKKHDNYQYHNKSEKIVAEIMPITHIE